MQTTLISSNSTLFYRLFLPMFFTVLLSAIVIASWADADGGLLSSFLPSLMGNSLLSLLLVSWLALVYFKLWGLKRVSSDDQNIYVSNYWHTARYSLEDIERINERSTLWLSMATIRLRGKGRFGRDLRFIKGPDAAPFFAKLKDSTLA